MLCIHLIRKTLCTSFEMNEVGSFRKEQRRVYHGPIVFLPKKLWWPFD